MQQLRSFSLPPAQHRLGIAFEIPEQRRDGREQLARHVGRAARHEAAMDFGEPRLERGIDQRGAGERVALGGLVERGAAEARHLAHHLGDYAQFRIAQYRHRNATTLSDRRQLRAGRYSGSYLVGPFLERQVGQPAPASLGRAAALGYYSTARRVERAALFLSRRLGQELSSPKIRQPALGHTRSPARCRPPPRQIETPVPLRRNARRATVFFGRAKKGHSGRGADSLASADNRIGTLNSSA